tara:strand:- start:8052 stop:8264 length:213 start_codon:yes stop_codon:yes gene_type:complete
VKIKYKRTKHLPWSLGVTSDDKMIHGKVRHHGEAWGYGYNKDKPIPKLDRNQLEALIIKKNVKLKVVGVN